MPQRVTLLAHNRSPHKRGTPHARTPPSGLLFLLIQVIEPVPQRAQPVTGKEGSPLRPVTEPLRQGGRPADRRLP
ncbi:hypothetical protein GCM10010270_24290 [Streptomyces violaceus]|nr:hypothetical protein GCM10010270_24290 [Streptomyces janthinus]